MQSIVVWDGTMEVVEGNVVMVVGRLWFEDNVDDDWEFDADNDETDETALHELSESIATWGGGVSAASFNDVSSDKIRWTDGAREEIWPFFVDDQWKSFYFVSSYLLMVYSLSEAENEPLHPNPFL